MPDKQPGTGPVPASIQVRSLDAAAVADFRQLLGQPPEGWCWCVAWEVPSWDGWAERSATQNQSLRESLWVAGEYDAYLIYAGSSPIGWIRVGPASHWPKLISQRQLRDVDNVYAVTCMGMRPTYRRQGLMLAAMRLVVADLAAQGVRELLAVPKNLPAADQAAGEIWNGPRMLFEQLGFKVTRTHQDFVELRLALNS